MVRSRVIASDDVDDPTMPYAARAGAAQTTPATQLAVFSATEQLLQQVSLGELTVEQILQRASVSRTTFYKNFPSKYAVVSAMLAALQDELIDVMQPWFARHDRRPEPALCDAITAVAEVWARHRPTMRASSENWHSEPEVGRPWVAMLNRFIADISRQIDAERRRHAAPAGVNSTALARTLVWSSERMLYLAGFGMLGDGSEADAVDSLLAMWVGTIYHGTRPPKPKEG